MKDGCIFCNIIVGQLPSIKIYEDEKTYAFLDITPINAGHTLVVPKKHSDNILSIEDEDFCAVSSTVRKIAKAMKEALECDGVNVHMNNEKDAGQIIFHSHVHVIPRYKSDGYEHWHGKRDVEKTILEEAGEKIKSKL